MVKFRSFIYALIDPNEPKHVRYVGMAMQPNRPYKHARNARQSAKHSHLFHWIRLLQSSGREPAVLVLEELPAGCSRAFCGSIEKMYIDSLRQIGHRLTNVSEGGWGGNTGAYDKAAASNTGKKRSEETRARMRANANRSPEVRARMSEAAKKRHRSSEELAKLHARNIARVGKPAPHPHSAETRAKIGAKQRAHWESLPENQRSLKTAAARQALIRDEKSGQYRAREESNG